MGPPAMPSYQHALGNCICGIGCPGGGTRKEDQNREADMHRHTHADVCTQLEMKFISFRFGLDRTLPMEDTY